MISSCTSCKSCNPVKLVLRGQALVDRFDPAVGFDEAGSPGRPFGRQAFTLDLIQGFTSFDFPAYDLGRLLKHAVIALQIIKRGDWTMTGDQFGVRRDLGD